MGWNVVALLTGPEGPTGPAGPQGPAGADGGTTPHHARHATGGDDALAPADIGAAAASHGHAGADITSGTVAYARLPVGTGASTVAAGNDSRLSDARTPTAHAGSHASGGSDPVSPAAIGAATSGHNHDSSYSAVGHTHTAPTPQSLASSATLTMDGSLGNHFRCTALSTNTTVAVPTSTSDGQRLILEVVASAATRTISLNGSIVNMSGATFALSLASGKRATLGFLISGGTAYLLSVAVQP